MGLPFKRIETWQSFQGVALPDATAWDKVKELYDIVKPVHQALETVASEASLFHYDDTPKDHARNNFPFCISPSRHLKMFLIEKNPQHARLTSGFCQSEHFNLA